MMRPREDLVPVPMRRGPGRPRMPRLVVEVVANAATTAIVVELLRVPGVT
jgi:hypothetical protein